MEYRLLRYFIAAEEELHLAGAAEGLGIEQSPASRAMRELVFRHCKPTDNALVVKEVQREP